jgi:general secretion pathway protein L
MPVVVMLKRWFEVLTVMLFALREALRTNRLLTVSPEQGGFTIRRAGLQDGSVLAAVTAGTQVSEEVARIASKGLVELELSPDKVVVRRISIPAQAQEFLAGIVRNQIECLSPWQADQTVFGFSSNLNGEDTAGLDVHVLITSWTAIHAAREQIGAIGLTVDRILARECGALKTSAPVLMWSRFANISPNEMQRTSWLIGAIIASFVILSLGLSSWAMLSASSIGTENESLAARARVLERQIRGAPINASLASSSPSERAWLAKQTSPSATVLLEALSRALPDSAFLTEFHLDRTSLRITGLAGDVPSLIAPLERSGHLAEVRFFAPTTRLPDGTRFKFFIEAKVERQPAAAEFQ